MRSQGSAKELERRRLLAVKRVAEGRSCAEVARFFEVSSKSVRMWYSAYLEGGEAALAAKPRIHAISRLCPEQESQVLGWLVKSPIEDEFGFATELWTAPRVAGLIRERFGVKYHPGHLLRWLAKRGVTPQMVRRRPRNHNPQEMKRWADEEWPRILKKRPSGRHTSSQSMRRV